jgi:hypothetical protein
MKNNYGLPATELQKIFERDKVCVYCKKTMMSHDTGNIRSDWYSIEHLNYLPPWNNPATVTISCWSCNSSRGNKKIRDWFTKPYCLERGIELDTVSKVVRRYILEVEDKE